jgi:hypothetical protein
LKLVLNSGLYDGSKKVYETPPSLPYLPYKFQLGKVEPGVLSIFRCRTNVECRTKNKVHHHNKYPSNGLQPNPLTFRAIKTSSFEANCR